MKVGKYEISLCNHQEIGDRKRQEDYFGFSFNEDQNGNVDGAILILADGMGGLEGGDIASTIAVNAFKNYLDNALFSQDIAYQFRQAAIAANDAVYKAAKETEIGTTLVAVYIGEDFFQWISIGDSVIMLIRDGQILRLNQDHNLGVQLDQEVKQGIISYEDAKAREAERGYLTSSLGYEEIPKIDISKPEPYALGDTFVLSSDGLTDALSLKEILTTVAANKPEEVSQNLTRTALAAQRPGQDNISVMSATISGLASTKGGKLGTLSRLPFFLIGGLLLLAIALITYFFIIPNLGDDEDDELKTPIVTSTPTLTPTPTPTPAKQVTIKGKKVTPPKPKPKPSPDPDIPQTPDPASEPTPEPTEDWGDEEPEVTLPPLVPTPVPGSDDPGSEVITGEGGV